MSFYFSNKCRQLIEFADNNQVFEKKMKKEQDKYFIGKEYEILQRNENNISLQHELTSKVVNKDNLSLEEKLESNQDFEDKFIEPQKASVEINLKEYRYKINKNEML